MSEGIYENEGNVIGTNIDCPIYGNVGADKPKPGIFVIQHSDSVSCQWWKRPSGVATVCLGLLCVLLLAGIIGLSVYYRVIGHQYFTERDKLQTSNKNLTEERDQLQTRLFVIQKSLVKVFGNSNYYISIEKRNWEYARQDCLNRGAKLVIINNQEEHKFLISLSIRTWIGLTDRGTEGTWRWVDNTPLTTKYWGAKQPDNAGEGEDCAEINFCFPDPVNKWNDNPCTSQLNWICEKPID